MKKIFLALFIFFVSGMALRAEDAVQQFEGFNIVGYTDEGVKEWDITADSADIIGSLIRLTNVVANAYGEEKVQLTSKSGEVDKDSGKVHLENDVEITAHSGARLNTDSLDWDRESNLVKTEDLVRITDDQMILTGTGAKAEPSLKKAQLNENVKLNVDVKPAAQTRGQTVEIVCDGPLEIDQAKRVAVFNNNVVATEKTEARELRADRMKVFFNLETNQIEEIFCFGNVSVRQGENVVYSQELVYNATTQKMTLLGRPKLIFQTDEMKNFSLDNIETKEEKKK